VANSFIHMIGDKVTYKQQADCLRIFIRASSRGDKAKSQTILQKVKFLLVGGVLLVPLVIVSLDTEYRIWIIALAAAWLILFARLYSIYKYRESGEEQLFLTDKTLKYMAAFQICGLKFHLGKKKISFPIEILINPKPDVLHGLHGMEDDMNKVVSISDMGDRHVLKLRMEEKAGGELKKLIQDFIGEDKTC
jgi:hypothetical protein